MSWLDAFLSSYAAVQTVGAATVPRSILNFAAGITVADDPINARTNVSVTSIPTLIAPGADHLIDVGDANTGAIALHTTALQLIDTGEITLSCPVSNRFTLQASTFKFIDTANTLMFDAGTTGGINPHAISTSLDIVWINGKSQAPIITQNDNTTNGATAQSTTIQAQTATGTNSTGGDLILSPGTGTSAGGRVALANVATTTSAPSAGGAGALPATPAGYVTIRINGVNRQMPYY